MLCPGEFVGIRWRFSDSKLWLFNLFIWCWVRKDDLFLANATLSKVTFIKPKIIGLRIQTLLSNSSFIKCSGVREVEAAKYVSDERTTAQNYAYYESAANLLGSNITFFEETKHLSLARSSFTVNSIWSLHSLSIGINWPENEKCKGLELEWTRVTKFDDICRQW